MGDVVAVTAIVSLKGTDAAAPPVVGEAAHSAAPGEEAIKVRSSRVRG